MGVCTATTLNVHKYLAMSVPLRVCACMDVHKCPGMCVCLYRSVFIIHMFRYVYKSVCIGASLYMYKSLCALSIYTSSSECMYECVCVYEHPSMFISVC